MNNCLKEAETKQPTISNISNIPDYQPFNLKVDSSFNALKNTIMNSQLPQTNLQLQQINQPSQTYQNKLESLYSGNHHNTQRNSPQKNSGNIYSIKAAGGFKRANSNILADQIARDQQSLAVVPPMDVMSFLGMEVKRRQEIIQLKCDPLINQVKELTVKLETNQIPLEHVSEVVFILKQLELKLSWFKQQLQSIEREQKQLQPNKRHSDAPFKKENEIPSEGDGQSQSFSKDIIFKMEQTNYFRNKQYAKDISDRYLTNLPKQITSYERQASEEATKKQESFFHVKGKEEYPVSKIEEKYKMILAPPNIIDSILGRQTKDLLKTDGINNLGELSSKDVPLPYISQTSNELSQMNPSPIKDESSRISKMKLIDEVNIVLEKSDIFLLKQSGKKGKKEQQLHKRKNSQLNLTEQEIGNENGKSEYAQSSEIKAIMDSVKRKRSSYVDNNIQEGKDSQKASLLKNLLDKFNEASLENEQGQLAFESAKNDSRDLKKSNDKQFDNIIIQPSSPLRENKMNSNEKKKILLQPQNEVYKHEDLPPQQSNLYGQSPNLASSSSNQLKGQLTSSQLMNNPSVIPSGYLPSTFPSFMKSSGLSASSQISQNNQIQMTSACLSPNKSSGFYQTQTSQSFLRSDTPSNAINLQIPFQTAQVQVSSSSSNLSESNNNNYQPISLEKTSGVDEQSIGINLSSKTPPLEMLEKSNLNSMARNIEKTGLISPTTFLSSNSLALMPSSAKQSQTDPLKIQNLFINPFVKEDDMYSIKQPKTPFYKEKSPFNYSLSNFCVGKKLGHGKFADVFAAQQLIPFAS